MPASLDIWKDFSYQGAGTDGFRPTLDVYLVTEAPPDTAGRPGVLILPGSGYVECSPREAEAVARRFNAAGYHAWVLWYSCTPRRHPLPLLDCARALTLIRAHAAEWRLDPRRLALMGFSAGGHAALSQTLFYAQDFAQTAGVDPSARANALMLCYPVITSGEFAHRGSFQNLLGDAPDAGLLDLLSLERHIDASCPPVFIWHTAADGSVPVENSLLLATALRRARVPFELHVFPEGKHGLSLAVAETAAGDAENINPHAAQWFSLCLRWLDRESGHAAHEWYDDNRR